MAIPLYPRRSTKIYIFIFSFYNILNNDNTSENKDMFNELNDKSRVSLSIRSINSFVKI